MERVVEFPLQIERCCGLDIHQKTVVATVRGTDITECTRTFSTFTTDFESLCYWLESLEITDVAMESTGIYWKPIYTILDTHFKVILVNARRGDISDAGGNIGESPGKFQSLNILENGIILSANF